MDSIDEARLELGFVSEGLRALASLGDFTFRTVSELGNVVAPEEVPKTEDWTRRCEALAAELTQVANEMDGFADDLRLRKETGET